MKQYNSNNERGSALVMALFALMILAAVGMGMIYTANTETTINNNYRNSQQAYFAARAGLEEVRDRIFTGDITNLPSPKIMGTDKGLPAKTNGAIYVINPSGGETVAPWDKANKYFDDEYCHEAGAIADGSAPPGVKCQAVPTGPAANNWYSSINAKTLPTGVPLPYKWVRINLKSNQGARPWYVNRKTQDNYMQACYDGSQEIELPPSTLITAPTWARDFGVSKSDMLAAFWFGHGGNGNGNNNPPPTCNSVAPGTAGATACGCGSTQLGPDPMLNKVPPPTNCTDAGLEPIYVLTSLAVTGNGTRRMMQQEISKVTTPWPPASLSFAGPVNSMNFGTSDQYTIDGKDIVNNPTNLAAGTSTSAAPCGPDVPSVGATQDRMPVNGNGTNNNPTAFEQVVNAGGGAKTPFQGSDSGTLAGQCSPTTSDIRDATQALQGSTSSTAQLQQIYQNMVSIADYIGDQTGITTQAQAGTDAAPKINIIQGDCNMCAAFSGAGVLVITGNLTTAGKTTFNGLVIVLGGTVLMDGTSNVNGGMMVGNLNGGGINFSVNGGGAIGGVHFDSCRIQNAQNKKSFKVLATREVLY